MDLCGVQPLSIRLQGITNDEVDPCVDVLRTVTWPLLRKLSGEEDGWEFKVSRRGAPPKAGAVSVSPICRSNLCWKAESRGSPVTSMVVSQSMALAW